MHRIQNIVVPPRHRLRRFSRQPSPNGLLFHAAYRAIFPLDLASSLVRLALRLPSLYFLSKSLLLWSTTLAQTAHKFPSHSLLFLASWAAHYDTAALCWFTFCSVCGALCLEALTRGLEGANSNASPFNLVCYLPHVSSVIHRSLSSVRLCLSITHILIPNDTRHKAAGSPLPSRQACRLHHHSPSLTSPFPTPSICRVTQPLP